jgi:maleylpyruvate isomerase
MRAPSNLPDWSRAHVLAHLINQADAYRRMAWGAAHGLTLQQYPGGSAQREAEIERNAGWPADQLRVELERSADELRSALANMPEAGWSHTVIRVNGPMPAWQAMQARLLEVAAHHLDLATGHTTARWPAGLADVLLPDVAAGYERRTRASLGTRWQLERADGPGSWTLGNGEPAGEGHGGGGSAVGGVIRGPGELLLAWLLGRAPSAELAIEGDRAAADSIPARYPYGAQYRP